MKKILKSVLSLMLALTFVLSSVYVGFNGNLFAVETKAISKTDSVSIFERDSECKNHIFEKNAKSPRAKKHTLGKWVVLVKATTSQYGIKYQRCTTCDAIINIATIPQLKCPAVKLTKIANITGGVKITWTETNGADKYRVYRRVKNGKWGVIANTKNESYIDKTAKSGTTYYYCVRALNEVGLGATCKTTKSIKYLVAPVLDFSYISSDEVALNWTKSKGAKGYMLYCKKGDGAWKRIATLNGVSNLTYVYKIAVYGQEYTYKVKAFYGNSFSPYSYSITIFPVPATIPYVPETQYTTELIVEEDTNIISTTVPKINFDEDATTEINDAIG